MNNLEIRSEDIVFLLGAGASRKAGIPISTEMVNKVEFLIKSDSGWTKVRDLYFYLKSSILYSKGIFGNFDYNNFNIENILVIISNLKEKDKNLIYPFIGSWDLRLIDMAGDDFINLKTLNKKIRDELISWVTPKQYKGAIYYNGFNSLKNEINQTIKVFSLNYDLCFEKTIGEREVETGFGEGYEWHYSNFDIESNPKDFYLYKLHGSVNWYINKETKKLNKNENIETTDPHLIFGIEHKLLSIDPFFFYSSELRKASLDSKLIISIGFSYEDSYINGILAQALNSNDNIQLISVQPVENEEEKNDLTEKIKNKLELEAKDQIHIENYRAEDFLTNHMTKNYLGKYIKDEIFE